MLRYKCACGHDNWMDQKVCPNCGRQVTPPVAAAPVMDQVLSIAIVAAGQHFGRVIQLMVDGVAFNKDGKRYWVFSHEGDELGEISTADVCTAVYMMRRYGREVGKCHGADNKPAFTFAWVGWFPQQ